MSPVLIAGFHRSGTSAIARMIHAAGVHLGDELLGAEPSNPYGHFEDLEVVTMHDNFLQRAGHTWKSTGSAQQPLDDASTDELRTFIEQRNSTHKLWGAKDPRLCLYLDEWLSIAPDAQVVVVIRRPDQSVRSLHMRHSRRHVDTRGIDPSDLDFWRDPDLGLGLWVHYHQKLLSALRNDTSVHIVDFGDRAAVHDTVASLVQSWGLDVDQSNVPPLDAHLGNTAVAPLEVRSSDLLVEATNVWAALRERMDDNHPT